MAVCESCLIIPAGMTEPSSVPTAPYHLCAGCHHRLVTYSLRPREWYALASRHGWWQPLLHDDLYDETGEATQPDEDVERPEDHPCPTLAEVSGSAEGLFGHCMTRWCPSTAEAEAARGLPSDEMLRTLEGRLESSTDPGVWSVALWLAARGLGPKAADLVRRRWDALRTECLSELGQAAAMCLEGDEAFGRVTEALVGLPEREVRPRLAALGWLRDPRTLDWIERRGIEDVTAEWGRLAALSRFDWARATDWLSRGRPLSLVALDALRALVAPDTVMLRELRPRLLGVVSCDDVVQALKACAERDPTPRTRRVVFQLIAAADALVGPPSTTGC